MTKYIATINTPGNLPDSAEPPPEFEKAMDAWYYLCQERANSLDLDPSEEDELLEEVDRTYGELLAWVSCAEGLHGPNCPEGSPDGTGSVTGPTPGYDGDEDRGLAYSVMSVED